MIDVYAAGKVLQQVGLDGEVIVTGRWLNEVLEQLGGRDKRPVLDLLPPPPSARGK